VSWDIRDKVVLVTGGASGIGLATATELARRGANVTITSRSVDKATAAANAINESTGASVTGLGLDLSELEKIDSFLERYRQITDRVDVLINNAGTISAKRQVTRDGFELTLASNYIGPFYLTNQLIPLLSQTPASRILNVRASSLPP
jgi:Short-chain dehydrogenases of various substrate specificities